jgi:hypothetical protein
MTTEKAKREAARLWMEKATDHIHSRISRRASSQSVLGLLLLVSFSAAPDARGNIIITLAATGSDGTALPNPVPAGTKALVDVSLSVDDVDNPLLDLRSIQFDFGATTVTIALSTFQWVLPAGVDPSSYSQFTVLPQPRLVYLSSSRVGNSIIDLDTTPLQVATVEATVNSSGNIDLRNPGADATGGVAFQAGFGQPVDFNLAAHNVTGGTLRLNVEGATGTDSDRDGVPDAVDAFPFNPNESVDTDSDGIGNNADTDDDGDGVPDATDKYPLDPTESADTDGDGIPNNADTDDDNDGVPDAQDAFPLDPAESKDSNGNGIGDNADPNSPDTRNTGPRATGGLCGGSIAGAMLLTGWGLACLRIGRCRPAARVRSEA